MRFILFGNWIFAITMVFVAFSSMTGISAQGSLEDTLSYELSVRPKMGCSAKRIVIIGTLKNKGNYPLAIDLRNVWTAYSITSWDLNSKGSITIPEGISLHFGDLFEGDLPDPKDFWVLLPGKSYVAKKVLTVTLTGPYKPDRRFEMQAEYENRLERRINGAALAIGSINSNTVEFSTGKCHR